MIQRPGTRTFVLPVECLVDKQKRESTVVIALSTCADDSKGAVAYNAKIPTELSDKVLFTSPIAISRLLMLKDHHARAEAES
jgi:hypothetical protein